MFTPNIRTSIFTVTFLAITSISMPVMAQISTFNGYYRAPFGGAAGALAAVGTNPNATTPYGYGNVGTSPTGTQSNVQTSQFGASSPTSPTVLPQQGPNEGLQELQSLNAKLSGKLPQTSPKDDADKSHQSPSNADIVNPLALIGKQIDGKGVALSGDTLMVSGRKIELFGVTTPASGASCVNGDGLSYDCGSQAQHDLQHILDQGSLTCFIVSAGTPAPALCTILGQSVNNGMNYPN